MISPFEGLPVDQRLLCEFFATFARFEYALKATPRFCRRGHMSRAEPNWTAFAKEAGANLTEFADKEVVRAISYLCDCPPQVQKHQNQNAVFRPEPLHGEDVGEKAIEAARRVRNNLFHGGKHAPHSPAGRDQELIRCSLLVLQVCLVLCPDVRSEFEDLYA